MEKVSELKLHEKQYDKPIDINDLPVGSTYDFLLERNKKHMDQVALIFAGKKITYEELHTRVEEYARALYKRGVRQGDIIAVSVANSPECIYIDLAITRLGAITVPISPLDNSYKMLNDLEIVRPKMFIGINDAYKTFKTASKGMDIDVILFPAVKSIDNKIIKLLYMTKQVFNGNTLIGLDHQLSHVLKEGKNFEEAVFPKYVENTIDDIMFTGGSTGVHKGAMLTSTGFNSVVKSLDYISPLKSGEIFMGNLPQFMAFGKLSLHYALCNSLQIELTLKGMPKDFKEELFRIKPAGVFAGPIQWEAFINDLFREINSTIGKIDFSAISVSSYEEYIEYLRDVLNNCDTSKFDMSWLKMGVSGGEQLKMLTELICNMVFETLHAKDSLWNGLGMTEMCAPVAVKRGKKNSNGSLGPLLPYNRQAVIDINTHQELGINQVGLHCLQGPGMMHGYYNNPEESKKAFIDINGEKWLNTGDIVKVNEKGETIFVDRLKRCFVCGVENIYPQQIENMISRFPEIKESIITKVPDNEKQFLPKYHIYLKGDFVDIEELKTKIEKTIGSTLGVNYLPGYYEFHSEPLPRTASGKLDPKPLQEKDLKGEKKLVLS